MRHLSIQMWSFLAILTASTLALEANANSGRVERVRGSKAIVDFGSTPISVGDRVEKGSASGRSGPARRQHAITWNVSLLSLTPKGGSSTSSNSLNLSYGYNMSRYEFGGLMNYRSTSGAGDSSSLLLGGYGQYNFVENKVGHSFVPYAQGRFSMISGSGSGGASVSGNEMGIRGGLLWFFLNEQMAIDGGFAVAQQSVQAGGTSTDVQATEVYVGWRAYF